MPLSWRTRNYVGTIFGGSIYAAVDPVYMIMLIKNLGRDYVVWDKNATVRFRKTARTTLHARFLVSAEEVDEIRSKLALGDRIDRFYRVDLLDDAGMVYAEVDKTIHVRRRDASA